MQTTIGQRTGFSSYTLAPSRCAAGAGNEMMELTSEVERIQQCICALHDGREAHAKVLGEREKAVGELKALTAKRAAVQTRIVARENEIALSNAALPAAPFPEDPESALLERHVRIHQVRVGEWDKRVQRSMQTLKGLAEELNQAWIEVGISLSNSLHQEYCNAARALRDARLKMRATMSHFSGVEKVSWTFWPQLAIFDPRGGPDPYIVNPLLDGVQKKWPECARALLTELDALRKQVDAAKE